MADYNPALSVNDGNFTMTKNEVTTNNDSLRSDKEIMPEDLSDDQGEGHGHSGGPKASVPGCALNITNTIIGAGILGLPNVLNQFGVLLGCSIIILSYILTFISCSFLLKAKNLSKHSKYISIGKHCLGMKGLWAVKLIIIVNNFGLCIAYLIIFSTVASNLWSGFKDECKVDATAPFFCSHWFLTLCAAALVCPLIFFKSLAKLQFASAVAVFAAGTFSVMTVSHFFIGAVNGTNATDIHIVPHIADAVTALSSVTSVFLAFTFQFNFFPIYKTLENPTDSRMKQTTLSGLTLVLVIYLCVAICGYLAFGEANSGDFLKNYTRETLGTNIFIIVNIAFLFSSTLTLPLMFFGAKNEIYGAIKLIRKALDKQTESMEQTLRDTNDDEEKILEQRYGFQGPTFYLYIMVLYGLIVFFAVFVPGIDTVFSFVGSTAANALNFILPSIFYLILSSKKSKLRPIATGMAVLGVIMCFVGVITSSIKVARS